MGKQKGTKIRQYDEKDLMEAVSSVRNGTYTISAAARKYCVPRTTITDYLKKKSATVKKLGAPTMLTDTEEKALVEYILYMSDRSMPLRRCDLRTVILDLVKAAGLSRLERCQFNLVRGPSDEWFDKFQERNPQLTWKIPQSIDGTRITQANDYIVDDFFNKYESVIKRQNLIDCPSQIYNCDETGIGSKISSRCKAYGAKGSSVYQKKIISHEHITSMTCVSADGRILPNFIIFEKCLPKLSSDCGWPKDWMYTSSPNGYMDRQLFKSWFSRIFIPHCGNKRPVLLLMDNHDSHVSYDIMELAKENQIDILGFPPHTTHILQPLDVGVFQHVKKEYSALTVSMGLTSLDACVSKSHFPKVWQKALKHGATVKVIQSAFRKSGIFPFDPCAIDDTKITHRRVSTAPPAPSVHSVMPVAKCATDLDETVAYEYNPNMTCPTCGHQPHPLPSVRELLPAQQDTIIIPTATEKKQKKRNVPKTAREYTGTEMITSLKEKEEIFQKQEEDKMERQKLRQKKKEEKEKALENKETNKGSSIPKKRKRTEGEAKADKVTHVDEDLCHACALPQPPHYLSQRTIDWVMCDQCKNWYHCVCLNVNVIDVGESYTCPNCDSIVH